MHYDLDSSTDVELIWVIDILLMYKSKYATYLHYIEKGKDVPKRGFSLEKLRYHDGITLANFDNEIIEIQNELDKRCKKE